MSDVEKSSADLVRLLYAEDKAVRNAAAKELGSRGAEGFAVAVPLLADASWVVRYRACEIIGMTRQTEAFPRSAMRSQKSILTSLQMTGISIS